MATAFGESRDAAVVAEITKTYEKTIRGTLAELERHFHASPALGEIVIVVAGAPTAPTLEDESDAEVIVNIQAALEVLREAGLGLKQASAVLARLTGKARRELYQQAINPGEKM
jgi:16S rRNA (cytidine1402-2'-O)-methyltransferase